MCLFVNVNNSKTKHAALIAVNRLCFILSADLLSTNRSSLFSGHDGQLSLSAVFLDEYRDRLFLGGKDVLYSLLLSPISTESKEVCFDKQLVLKVFLSKASFLLQLVLYIVLYTFTTH